MSGEEELSRALQRIGRFIGFRPRSVKETVDKLRALEYSEETVKQAVSVLIESRVLDDAMFARVWAADRLGDRKFGASKVRAELRSKGIQEELIAEVLADAAAGSSETDRALEFLRRKFRKAPPDKTPDKLTALLGRQGYSFGAAKAAVKRFTADFPENGGGDEC